MNDSVVLSLLNAIIITQLRRCLSSNDKIDVYDKASEVLQSSRKANESVVGTSSSISVLRDFLDWSLVSYEANIQNDFFISRATISLGRDFPEFLDFIKTELDFKDKSDSDILSHISDLITQIDIELRREKLSRSLMRALAVSRSGATDHIGLQKNVTEVITDLNGLLSAADGTGPIGSSVFSTDATGDEEGSIEHIIESAQKIFDKSSSLKTGYKGLDDASGTGGIPRGHYFNVSACSHHYKSGMLLSLMTGVARNNKPNLFDKTKKPLLLRVTFENRLEQDIKVLYQDIYGATTKRKQTFRVFQEQMPLLLFVIT